MDRRANLAVITGAVIQDETGDAIGGAVVNLTAIDTGSGAALLTQYSNSKGGFSFDSVRPATYRLQVRKIGEIAGTDTVRLAAGRVDTLSLRMRASRCYGY